MKKKIIGLVLVLLFSLSFPVQAETISGGDGWSVTFDGKQMSSTFESTDIADAIYQLQPGDTAQIHLALKNEYDKETSWYLSNEVLQSLEDSQSVAEGGAYSYELAYFKQDGTIKLLYSSEAIGGETVNESGEGLHQATDSLKDFFYLDELASGDSGELLLTVKLEGETQGNEYQNTLAKLKMNFAVELPKAGNKAQPSMIQLVKTGDTTKLLFFIFLTLSAGMLCVVLAVYKIHKERGKTIEEESDFLEERGKR